MAEPLHTVFKVAQNFRPAALFFCVKPFFFKLRFNFFGSLFFRGKAQLIALYGVLAAYNFFFNILYQLLCFVKFLCQFIKLLCVFRYLLPRVFAAGNSLLGGAFRRYHFHALIGAFGS